MTNYSNSVIYKLCCKDPEIANVYIGSTTNFTKRKSVHKSKVHSEKSRDYNNHLYKFIRDTGGWGNWTMIEVEKFPTTDKRSLEKQERFWIEKLKSSLNKIIPTRTSAEYFQNNKEKCYKYREDNDDKVKKWNSKYRDKKGFKNKIKCKCGKIVSKGSMYNHIKTPFHLEYENRPYPNLIFVE